MIQVQSRDIFFDDNLLIMNIIEQTRKRGSEKMGLSTNVELARYALQHKLVD